MNKILTVLLCLFSGLGFAQQPGQMKPVPAKVAKALESGETFVKVQPFTGILDADRMDVPEEVRQSGWGLLPDLTVLKTIDQTRPAFLKMTIPGKANTSLTLLLYQVSVAAPDFQVIYSDGTVHHDVRGVHYRGIVEGDYGSLVSVSFFEDQIMALISDDAGNWNLGRLDQPTERNIHICYNDRDLAAFNPFRCDMEDVFSPQEDLDPPGHSPGQRNVGDCLRIWWDIGLTVVNNKGGGPAAEAWMTGVAAEVYTLYANETLDMTTHTFRVWTSAEPYTGGSSSARLTSYQTNNGTLAGDLAHYVTMNFGYGGIAAGFSGVCNANYDENMCFSDLNPTYNNVPTYSWTVMVCTHEMGHLIGSRHTHACVWNGNNTAIDGCAGYVEGACALPGYPAGGGTIMSYCHLQSVGINFNLGFGPQPGDVIRARVAGASCLTPCGVQAQCTFTLTCPANTTVSCGANPSPATTGNPTVQILSGSCSPTVTWSDNNNGLTLCNGTGYFIRTFSATDGNSTATCSQTITKVDNTPPVISGTANNASVNCNSPVPAAPVLSATDNCGTATLVLNEVISGITCGYTITRTWTATDNCGNTSTRQQVITVTDTTPPTARCKSGVEVYLNQDGEGSVSPYDVDDGTTDNCSGFSLALSPTQFTCADLGNAPVTLIATDDCGNVGQCNTTVRVIDALKPHMACKDLDIYLDVNGSAVILNPSDLDGGITDNCQVVIIELSQDVFGCDDIGKNTVKVTARDLSDNMNECDATVRVYDLIPPTWSTFPADLTVYCDEGSADEAPVADDNCGVTSIGMNDHQELLPGGPAGSYQVVRNWWAVDKSGNEVTGVQRVAVLPEGQIAVLCSPDITTAPSKAPVAVDWTEPTVDDICLGSFDMSRTEGPAPGSYFNPGPPTRITYAWEDAWGSRYECAFHVTVPLIDQDYSVRIQQADADCGTFLIGACSLQDVGNPLNASLVWNAKGTADNVEYHLQAGARLMMFADGTARLTGSWTDAGSTAGFDGVLWFHHRRTHGGWLNAGGKVNTSSGNGDPATWAFFEVDGSRSTLTGTGNNAGQDYTIQASPNFPGYGLQTGAGANGVNGASGGWVALASRNDQDQFTGRGILSFQSNCQALNLITDAGTVESLDGFNYGVTWSNGTNGPDLGNVAPGTYTVMVTDANGQTHNHTFKLVAPTDCELLWEDRCREDNKALEAAASQIHTWQGADAERATDGNTDGDFTNGSVASTLAGWQNWWTADLGQEYAVESVRIWPRTDISNPGLDPFWVFVSAGPVPALPPDQLVHLPGIRSVRHEGPMTEAWRMPVGMTGRYVRVQLEESGKLMLAEVEALVCQPDHLDPVPGDPFYPQGPGNANGDKQATTDDLAAWPNPATDELNLYIHQSRVSPAVVTITGLSGQTLYRKDLGESREYQLRVPVGGWLPGMVMITVSGADGVRTLPVLIQP